MQHYSEGELHNGWRFCLNCRMPQGSHTLVPDGLVCPIQVQPLPAAAVYTEAEKAAIRDKATLEVNKIREINDHETDSVRRFGSGATRNLDSNKLDYEAFLSPVVLERYARYMHLHRKQKDGSIRSGDNWTKGIPRRQYLKSWFRHFFDVYALLRDFPDVSIEKDMEEALCAALFNNMGLLHEVLVGRSVPDENTVEHFSAADHPKLQQQKEK